MKNFKYLFIIVAAVLLFASCSNEDDDVDNEVIEQDFLTKNDDTKWFEDDGDITYLRINNSLTNPVSIRYFDEVNKCYRIYDFNGLEIIENSTNILKLRISTSNDPELVTLTIEGANLKLISDKGYTQILSESDIIFDDLQMCTP